MKKIFIFSFLFFIILFYGCVKRNIPANVLNTVEDSKNRDEFEKAIKHYLHENDSLKLKSLYFLIENIEDRGYVVFKLVDSAENKIDFNIFDYEDYERLSEALDSIEQKYGTIDFKVDTIIKDKDIITSDFLIENIEFAFKAWNLPWAKNLSFENFCEYILSYRGSEEPLSRWRKYFFERYSKLIDSLKYNDDPLLVATKINNDLKEWFKFDPRFYLHPTDQGLDEMLNNKSGRCEDMTNLAIYAMRSVGVPVLSDYVPYWANTSNNHAWNATIDKEGKVIPFMGAEKNPGEYSLSNRIAKVYRKTFLKNENPIKAKIKDYEKIPRYLGGNSYIDVTDEYVKTKDIFVELNNFKDSASVVYLCVFNAGDWKPIHFGELQDGKGFFTKMGLDVAYLPIYYLDEKIIPAGFPFILTYEGEQEYLKPDSNKLINVKLYSTTKRIVQNATDNVKKVFLEKDKFYELFYWNDKWVSLGVRESKGEPLEFNNIPSNSLYRLVEVNSNDEEERIFTIGKDGSQIWW